MVKRSGAEVLAEMLQGYGVTHVFMVPSDPAGAPWPRWNGARRSGASRCMPRSRPPTWPTDMQGPAGHPGICMAQVVGALNLAAGLRDAWLAQRPGHRHDRRPRPTHQVPQGLSGSGRRAGLRAGDEVQRDRGRGNPHSRPGAPGLPGRRVGQVPGRCTCNSGATRGRSTTKKRRWSPSLRSCSRRCRPSGPRLRPSMRARHSTRSRRRSGRCSSPAAAFAHRAQARQNW